tara:strand:+ start:236 stop:592 length:357 start_codon:yes stop_codon:yes gene_type:complete
MIKRKRWTTTQNKRRKLATMRELGFEPCGKSSERDLHERVACLVCGYQTPFYRLGLARKHRDRCDASSRPQQRVETTQRHVDTSTLDERELLRRCAFAFATRNEHDTSYDDEPIKWGP